jgi:putative transposase
MKKSKFTEQQIDFALQQAQSGTQVAEVCRKMGISEVDVLSLETVLWRPDALRGEEATSRGGELATTQGGCRCDFDSR